VSNTIKAFHVDKLPLGSVKKTDEGFLMVNAPIAKVGVMSYMLKDGTVRRELVDEETLNNNDSNESLNLKPVTNTHPPEKIVTSNTAKFRNVGAVGKSEFKNKALYADFSITNQDAIRDIDNGRKQLSPGYRVDLIMESGVFEGQRYDAIQRNRRYNHLAIVDNARGGSELKLNIDHCDSDDGIQFINNNDEESKNMENIRIDTGLSYEAAPEVANYVAKLEAKVDGLKDDVKTANEKASQFEAKADSLSEEVESLKKVDSQEVIDAAVKERISIEKTATRVLKEDSFDGLTNVEVMKKVVVAKYPESKQKLDSKDEVYVQARFDAIAEKLDDDAFEKQRKTVENRDGKQEEIKTDSKAARDRMIKHSQNAWKRGDE
jgi:hypothetical protein